MGVFLYLKHVRQATLLMSYKHFSTVTSSLNMNTPSRQLNWQRWLSAACETYPLQMGCCGSNVYVRSGKTELQWTSNSPPRTTSPGLCISLRSNFLHNLQDDGTKEVEEYKEEKKNMIGMNKRRNMSRKALITAPLPSQQFLFVTWLVILYAGLCHPKCIISINTAHQGMGYGGRT